jgi:hypothetical protein
VPAPILTVPTHNREPHHAISRLPMADEFTLSSQGCHLPTVNEGVQKLSGQKRIEMRY